MYCEQIRNSFKSNPISPFQIVETMVTQNASVEVLDGLVKAGCVERLLDICQLPVIRIELAQSTLPNTIANIIKFLLVSLSMPCFNFWPFCIDSFIIQILI